MESADARGGSPPPSAPLLPPTTFAPPEAFRRSACSPPGKACACVPNVTTTALMLSQPTPLPPQSGARQSSSSASAASRSPVPWASCSRTKSTTSWLVFTSKIPSQPSTRNSSSASASSPSDASALSRNVCVMISGIAVTACSAAGTSLLCLNSESPIARLRLSTPFTRPSATKHLAFSMRLSSSGSSGLWSRLSATAAPPRDSTHRLSPQFATTREFPRTTATTAVQPAAGPDTSPPVVGGRRSSAVATVCPGGVT
mmetsp:Transcript_12484/g.52518  ORF Transcript_12484/g.52518 Transcript_12484/m.52518 type:complete len:257 (-) Transcript_12484:899-1669(-)